MAKLSPAAQAVFWAFNSKFDWKEDGIPDDQFKAIAAALRTAADRVVPAPRLRYDSCCDVNAAAIRAELLAISIELEAQ